MAGQVKILGRSYPTWGVTAIAVGGVIAVYLALKSKKAAAANAAASTAANAVDPVTGLPYSEDQSLDPLTGMTYLAEAQQYGSVAAAESAYETQQQSLNNEYGTGDYGSNYDGTGLLGSVGTSDSSSALTYASNAQWAQAVTAGLADIGYNAESVGSALGAYLAGLPETAAQATIVQTALAEYGPPPTGALQIVLASTTTTTPTNVTVPNVVGDSQSAADAALSAASLLASVAGGSADPVTAQSPAAGASVSPNSTVQITLTTPVTTTQTQGSCPSGYTFSVLQTGKSGEMPATGGYGYCELNPATTTTTTASTYTVPNFVGMYYGDFFNELAYGDILVGTGINLNVTGDQVGSSIVVSQSPAAGTKLAPGGQLTVNLTNSPAAAEQQAAAYEASPGYSQLPPNLRA